MKQKTGLETQTKETNLASEENKTQTIQLLIKNGLFVQRELNQICQQFGLSTNQFSVLDIIVAKGPLSQKDLCKKLLFEKSNISKIVATLMGKDLINVISAPLDRRITLLIETQEGNELWKQCRKLFSQVSMDLLSTLSDTEQSDALKLLKTIEQNFKSRIKK